MIRFHALGLGLATLLACANGTAPPTATSSASSSSASSGAGGSGGMMVSSSMSSSSSSGTGGAGGSGGEAGGKPTCDCSKLNPGITCVEDNDCPLLSKECEFCGPWSCVVDVRTGARGCVLPEKLKGR